jgi:hypothetical protein
VRDLDPDPGQLGHQRLPAFLLEHEDVLGLIGELEDEHHRLALVSGLDPDARTELGGGVLYEQAIAA